jgi:hypothetical protein
MAPIPGNIGANPQAGNEPVKKDGGMATGTIVALSLFAFFVVGFAITLTAYYLHRRAELNKLPPEKRPVSYRPFRTTSSSAKAGLLANAAPSPEEDKSSMFSRDRGSSLSLYVDEELEVRSKRTSIDTVSLIPLQVTPVEEVHDPIMGRTNSEGSAVSSRLSLTPAALLPEDSYDLGTRSTRPRSTSATSVRYYDANATNAAPQIPKIVHTPSE